MNVNDKLKGVLLRLEKYKETEDALRLKLAKHDYSQEKLEIDKESQDRRHLEEVTRGIVRTCVHIICHVCENKMA